MRMRQGKAALLAVSFVCALTLAACGGGSDDSTTSETTAADTAAETTAATEPAETGAEAAATGAEAASGEAANIAFFVPIKNSYVDSNIKAVEAVASELGGTVETFVSDFDAQKQATQIQDAIASGNYNAFLIYPVDSVGVVPFVEEAVEAGIATAIETIAVGESLETEAIQVDGVVSSAANPPYLDGQSIGQAVVEACEGVDPCNVIHLAGNFAFGYDVGLRDGVKDAIKDHPNIKIVATGEGEYQADPAYNVMRDLLQANSDVDVVFAASDVMMGGAERALSDAGIEVGPDTVKLIGDGGSEIAYKGISDGTWWRSLVWLPETSARFNVENLFRAVRGEPIPEPSAVYTSRDLSPIGLFMTSENAADLEPQWVGN